METSLFNRVQATLLAVATAALFVLAVLNVKEEHEFAQPDDGIWWREAANGLQADRVLPNGPGQVAGIHVGDLLTSAATCYPGSQESLAPFQQSLPQNSCADRPVTRLSDQEQALFHAGPYGQVFYSITRDGVPLDQPVKVIPVPVDRSLAMGMRVIGLIYLVIGFYVLFRRWGAPRSTHFYLFSLVSFAWYSLKYTGKFDALDQIVYWANIVAESLQPALFLHFALSFPEERLKKLGRSLLLPVVYAPGVALLGLWLWAINTRLATGLLRHRLDQTGTAYVAAFYVMAALLFIRSYSKASSPLLRQQLKLVMRGTLLAVLPFTFFFAVPFLLD